MTHVVPLIFESLAGFFFGSLVRRKPAVSQLRNHLAIARLAKKLRDTRANHLADIGDALQFLRRRFHQRVEVGKMIGQRARRAHPDMQNSDPKQEAPERLLLAPLDRGEQIRHALLSHPLEAGQLLVR